MVHPTGNVIYIQRVKLLFITAHLMEVVKKGVYTRNQENNLENWKLGVEKLFKREFYWGFTYYELTIECQTLKWACNHHISFNGITQMIVKMLVIIIYIISSLVFYMIVYFIG